jgi:putative transposase
MKKRFTEEQIIQVLKEYASGGSAGELCRRHGISGTTLYKWKAKYGGMEVSDAKKLKSLESENAKLKRLVADLSLDKVVLQDLLSKNW